MPNSFDWIAIPVILALGFLGFRRGFLEELGRLIGLIVSTIYSLTYHQNLALWLYELTPFDLSTLTIVSYIIIFFIFLFTIRILTKLIQVFMLSKGIRGTNKSLGFAFGVLKGIVIILIIFWMIDIMPGSEKFTNFKSASILYRKLNGSRQWLAKSFGFEETFIQSEKWIKEQFGNKGLLND